MTHPLSATEWQQFMLWNLNLYRCVDAVDTRIQNRGRFVFDQLLPDRRSIRGAKCLDIVEDEHRHSPTVQILSASDVVDLPDQVMSETRQPPRDMRMVVEIKFLR